MPIRSHAEASERIHASRIQKCSGGDLLLLRSFADLGVCNAARGEITRAVAVNATSDIPAASPRQFLQAFAAVALRVKPDDLPAYVSAAIKLRPDLTMNTVVVAVKIAAKNGEENSEILGTTIDSIVKAAVAAKPGAAVSIAEAATYGVPQLRECVVNAAIAAAPEAKSEIENVVGLNRPPQAFLTMSASDTNGFWFTPASLNAANISRASDVVSPEQPPAR